MSVNREPSLTESSVDRVSRAQTEPDWLRQLRQDALLTYAATPAPTMLDEEWRRTDVSWVPWDELDVTRNGHVPDAVPDDPPLEALQPSAVIAQAGGRAALVHVSPAAQQAGLVVGALSDVARDRPDLLRDELGTRAVTPDQGKLQAMNAAAWTGGAFLHVPDGMELEGPVVYVVTGDGPAALPRLHVRLGHGAAATVVEWWRSSDDVLQFANGTVELFVGPGSRLAYTHAQAWGPQAGSFLSQRAVLERDAQLTATNLTLGGRFHKARIESSIQGPGATVAMNGLYYLTGNQFVDHHTLQDHTATDSVSDLKYVGALDGTSRSVYAGTIVVEPDAQRSNAYQNNRNLMLHSGPRADSIPRLEIMADDVRCTHGATTSTIDPDQMFYLQSSGLASERAEGLIVDGLFEPVLDRVTDDRVRDLLRSAIRAKLAAARHSPAG